MSNTGSSDWSHQFPGWLHTGKGEEIPYWTVYLLQKIPVRKEDFQWAWGMAEQLGIVADAPQPQA